jgi:hypothetical protein
MKPSRRPEQARRQHRKQLQHKGLLGTRTPCMLIQGTAPDVIEDPVNQLVGTGLTYVDIPDEQTTSVQPPTTFLPWCAGSENGIRQSKCYDTSSVCLSSIFCNYAGTVRFSASFLPCTYILFRFSKASCSFSRQEPKLSNQHHKQAGRIRNHLRHEQDIALAAAHRPCPPQPARCSPLWRLYLFQDVAGSSFVRQHQPRCYIVGHSR